MTESIDFYFDFSSPYGYLAAQRIDALAERHGREAVWRPFLLGAVFKTTRSEPLLGIPMKGDYANLDLARNARLLEIPFTLPTPFPFMSVAACRAFYWLDDRDRSQAKALAREVFRRSFAEGRDMSSAEAVLEAAESQSCDRAALQAALQDPAVKDRLRREVEAAIARGAFGSPYIFVGDEPFWGNDRLDQVERWLETGGW